MEVKDHKDELPEIPLIASVICASVVMTLIIAPIAFIIYLTIANEWYMVFAAIGSFFVWIMTTFVGTIIKFIGYALFVATLIGIIVLIGGTK